MSQGSYKKCMLCGSMKAPLDFVAESERNRRFCIRCERTSQTCPVCNEEKKLREFYFEKQVHTHCKDCKPITQLAVVTQQAVSESYGTSLSSMSEYMIELERLYGGRSALCESIVNFIEKPKLADNSRLRGYQMLLNFVTAANKLEPQDKAVESMSDVELAEHYEQWSSKQKPKLADGA